MRKRKKERSFTNDVAAIINFSIGGLGSYYIGTGNIDEKAWFLFYLLLSYFSSEAQFYVKTMIREKKQSTL
ncbi:YwiC-like family protein [Anoxybacillus sp. KU2-6(11)]|uniref:YwiC-like family protein n=1 Tax=Anoxybacillus sp. KU2-6(11) TaxID=1535751 RepID=UPI000A59E30A|nr:YwiC-like family protein [Anoxybacillus sp. KU2-6(11)]